MKAKFKLIGKSDSTKITVEVHIQKDPGALVKEEFNNLKSNLKNQMFDVLTGSLPYTSFDVDQIKIQ